jgi:hypothetical protein
MGFVIDLLFLFTACIYIIIYIFIFLFGGSEKNAQHYADELIKLSPVDGYLSKGRIDEYFKRDKKY